MLSRQRFALSKQWTVPAWRRHFSEKCPMHGENVEGPGQLPSHDHSNKAPKPFNSIPGPPLYPFVGSIFDFKKRLSEGLLYCDIQRAYRKQYGEIVRINLTGDEVFVFDPKEFLKVHRAEGQFPKNSIHELWPFNNYYEESNTFRPGLSKAGKEWQDTRRKLQPDIMSPKAAASYIPSLDGVASDISAAFPLLSTDIEQFCMKAVFDMFSAAVLGRTYHTLIAEKTDQEGYEFAFNTQEAFRLCGDLLVDPTEKILRNMGIETPKWKRFKHFMNLSFSSARHLTEKSLQNVKAMENIHRENDVIDKVDAVKMFDGDEDSTANSAYNIEGSYMQRLVQRGSLSLEEAANEVPPLVFAGVDTTASMLHWLLLNLARNPDKQKILANELKQVLNGANFSSDASLPYLKACTRESHRISPAVSGIGYRKLDSDITLHGYNIPAGTKINFNFEALQKDNEVVDEPEKFLPERWFPENVKERKGTPAEIIDHRLIATPFSFGPRMCIGGRLAEVEVMTCVSRIVQDYEFSLSPNQPEIGRRERLMLMPHPSPKFNVKQRN